MTSEERIEVLFIQHHSLNTMASAQFVFYLTCLFLGEMAQMNHLNVSSRVHQDRGFLSANTGDSVTLQCFYRDDIIARFYWYKQIPGQKLRLISMFYKYETENIFYDEFKNNPRFSLDTEKGKNHLKITNVHTSDSATYYCAGSYSFTFEFAEGTTLSVKGSGLNFQALVQQSASQTIQPGDSLTLNCTVHTGTCDGEHSVYWFKTQEESHPRIIYTRGGKNDECGKKLNTQTCVYNLPVKNLSHAGTYYCAVASCGHIVFGNGTKLDFKYEVDSLVSVHILWGALAITTFMSVFQAFLMCVILKRNRFKSKELHSRPPSATNAEGNQDEENIHYAALKHDKVNRSRRQRNRDAECVYSGIKQ
ncbi:immunoglobulin alpha-2 heavy chain-like isoform X2 [Acanthochromis polyacanthus]|uniref:immunoglobulin alpha-2 heavy chain-like isoform X2 n=1 Tax=Acanthochromis polyacanthus TaxID=80966 RepID=UPI0022348BA4|nr:immunoglobulin alpha-2 heavy chain-like isoform X2 [Acanthochromis polyacanthus]